MSLTITIFKKVSNVCTPIQDQLSLNVVREVKQAATAALQHEDGRTKTASAKQRYM